MKTRNDIFVAINMSLAAPPTFEHITGYGERIKQLVMDPGDSLRDTMLEIAITAVAAVEHQIKVDRIASAFAEHIDATILKRAKEFLSRTKEDYINALIGKGVDDIRTCVELTNAGLMRFTGNQWNEDWDYNREALEKLPKSKLALAYYNSPLALLESEPEDASGVMPS